MNPMTARLDSSASKPASSAILSVVGIKLLLPP
jgi:hypothetical protein